MLSDHAHDLLWRAFPVGDAPPGCKPDCEDVSDDRLSDFGVALHGYVTAAAAKEQRIKRLDFEATCIREGNRVKIVSSIQTECYVDLEAVEAIDDGLVAFRFAHDFLGQFK